MKTPKPKIFTKSSEKNNNESNRISINLDVDQHKGAD